MAENVPSTLDGWRAAEDRDVRPDAETEVGDIDQARGEAVTRANGSPGQRKRNVKCPAHVDNGSHQFGMVTGGGNSDFRSMRNATCRGVPALGGSYLGNAGTGGALYVGDAGIARATRKGRT